MTFQEYPKRITLPDGKRVRVLSREEEDALLVPAAATTAVLEEQVPVEEAQVYETQAEDAQPAADEQGAGATPVEPAPAASDQVGG